MAKTIKTHIFYYRYNLDSYFKNSQETRKTYKQLTTLLRNANYPLFDFIPYGLGGREQHRRFVSIIQNLSAKEITIDCNYLFQSQFNTAEESKSLRIHFWAEYIYPNRDIKEGYFIIATPQLQKTLLTTYKCGYCGKNYSQTKAHNRQGLCSCHSDPNIKPIYKKLTILKPIQTIQKLPKTIKISDLPNLTIKESKESN
jgi:protein-arginine kinase activator protein McsA